MSEICDVEVDVKNLNGKIVLEKPAVLIDKLKKSHFSTEKL
jgi:hypothetical protein